MVSRKSEELFAKIMRGAEERMRLAEQAELERRQQELNALGATLSGIRLHKDEQIRCVVEQIDAEIADVSAQRDRTSNMNKRVELKAEIAHLRNIRASVTGENKRRPPESGVPMPAIPPRGPLPKHGGAAAPIDSNPD